MLDPVTLAVLQGRLEQIADEMDATLYRSAFNPIIAEAHDACHGLYDAATGDTLVQGKSGPADVRRRHGLRRRAVIAMAARERRRGGMPDGDVWICNDPYDGGTHSTTSSWCGRSFATARSICYLASVGALARRRRRGARQLQPGRHRVLAGRRCRSRRCASCATACSSRDVLGILRGQHAAARQPLGRPQRPARRARARRAAAARPARRVRRRDRC